jgi:glutathione S-transferase
MTLYGSRLSPYVRKVLLYAGARGLDIGFKGAFGARGDEAYLAASPFRTIPAFADDDYLLADSSAIIHYLEAKYADGALIPAEPRARGRAIWFDELADTICFGAIQPIFWNRLVAPMMGAPVDAAAAAAAERDKVPPVLAYLEGELAGRDWLVGETLTLADIAVASPLYNLDYVHPPLDPARFPSLLRWRAAIAALPWARAVAAAEAEDAARRGARATV